MFSIETWVEYYGVVAGFRRNAKLYLAHSLISALAFSIEGLVFNLYILSLGFSKEFVGLLNSLPALAIAVLALPLGLLSERLGHRKALVGAVLLQAAAVTGQVFFTGAGALVALNLVLGIGIAFSQLLAGPLMARHSTEEERTHLFAAQFALMIFAGAVGAAIAGYIPSGVSLLMGLAQSGESMGAYRGTVLVGGVCILLSILPPLLMKEHVGADLASARPDDSVGRPPVGRPGGALVPALQKTPGNEGETGSSATQIGLAAKFPGWAVTVRILTPQLLTALGAGALMPFLNVFYKLQYRISDPALGWLFSAGQVVMAGAVLLGPVLARTRGRTQALVWLYAGSLPFLIMMGFSPAFIWSAVAFVIRGAFMSTVNPLFNAMAFEQVAQNCRLRLSSLMAMAWNAGWMVSAYASGIVQEHYGFAPLFIFMGALYALAAVSLRPFFPKPASAQAASSADS
ncbi:MAG: MFS transporter [bacterium]